MSTREWESAPASYVWGKRNLLKRFEVLPRSDRVSSRCLELSEVMAQDDAFELVLCSGESLFYNAYRFLNPT
ncbi:hypothetical protein [Salinibacter grassmerensis]|uniref:hypothetical protein n=1 Tax=Salinibacter grassmerensis TaxID=3040353 RepID=UPI0021E79608|nr:hypothetical protein [Salinibacter grassmerensis]